MFNTGYNPRPEWLPTVWVKVGNPASSIAHISAPYSAGTGAYSPLCGKLRNRAELLGSLPRIRHSNCTQCRISAGRIESAEWPRYRTEEETAMMRDDAVAAYNRAQEDFRGRIHQAEYSRDAFVILHTQGIDQAMVFAAARYDEDLENAHQDKELEERWAERRRARAAERALAEVTVEVNQTPIQTPIQALMATMAQTNRNLSENFAALNARVAEAAQRARELGAEVTTVQDETVIRYPEVSTLGQRARAMAEAYQAERLEGESVSAWYRRTRQADSPVTAILRRQYIPDPDPSEVPEWEHDGRYEDQDTESIQVGDWVYPVFNRRARGWVVGIGTEDFPMARLVDRDGRPWVALVDRLRIATDAPEGPIPVPDVDLGEAATDVARRIREARARVTERAQNLVATERLVQDRINDPETTEGYVTTNRYLSMDAVPTEHSEAQKTGATARGRKAYAADFLGQPMIPGRTRVEHEADRDNFGRVTRSEDPAVWVRWDDDPGHEYRYVAGELRII